MHGGWGVCDACVRACAIRRVREKASLCIGKSHPTLRVFLLLAAQAYCIVPCCALGVHIPFVLRIQSEVEFSLKQAQPAVVMRQPGEITALSAGTPRCGRGWPAAPSTSRG